MTRWTKAREVLATVALGFACVALAALAVALVEIDREIPATAAALRSTIADVGSSARDVADAAENAQRDFADASNELISESDKLTTESYLVLAIAGATESELHKAAKAQRLLWEVESPKLVTKLNDSFDKFNLALDGAGQIIRSADGTLQRSWPLLAAGTKLTTDLDAKLTDPRTEAMLTNGAAISESGKGIADDSQKALHRFLTPAQHNWKSSLTVGAQLAKFLFEARYYALMGK